MENKEFDFHKIETFADACMSLGISAESLQADSLGDVEALLQANAFYRLLIIQKAINNDVWSDKDGWSYYPYWVLYSEKVMKRMSEDEKRIYDFKKLTLCINANPIIYSDVRCVVARCAGMVTAAYGLPLCFNSEEAAHYAAKQFEDLFFQYYGIKVK